MGEIWGNCKTQAPELSCPRDKGAGVFIRKLLPVIGRELLGRGAVGRVIKFYAVHTVRMVFQDWGMLREALTASATVRNCDIHNEGKEHEDEQAKAL